MTKGSIRQNTVTDEFGLPFFLTPTATVITDFSARVHGTVMCVLEEQG